jgi:hypothetical protein
VHVRGAAPTPPASRPTVGRTATAVRGGGRRPSRPGPSDPGTVLAVGTSGNGAPGVTRRQAGAALVALGVVYLVMLTVARLAIVPRISPDGTGSALLWAWFLTCVVGASVAAGHLGGVGVGRGLGSGAGFLVSFVLVGPAVATLFAYYLPERPIVFGIALGVQLVVLLPPRGVLAPIWRFALPVAGDLGASLLVPVGGGVSGLGLVALTAALTAVWLAEARFGAAASPR